MADIPKTKQKRRIDAPISAKTDMVAVCVCVCVREREKVLGFGW